MMLMKNMPERVPHALLVIAPTTSVTAQAETHALTQFSFTEEIAVAYERTAAEILAAVKEDVNAHTAGAEPSDDATMLGLVYN